MKFKFFGLLLVLVTVSCNSGTSENKDGKTAEQNKKKEVQNNKPGSTLVEDEVVYEADGISMVGYIVYDKRFTGKRPGILVVHEWWGQNDHTRNSARALAKAGYIAMAVDMYGDGKEASHPEEAQEFSSEVMSNFSKSKQRFTQARQILENHEMTRPENMAAIGYCFGGGVVLNMARQGTDLDAVVSLHGSLSAIEKAKDGKVQARILVLNGADDPFVPQQQIEAFKAEMDAANADYEFVNFPGAKHGFTNPQATKLGNEYDLPLEYDEGADEESWEMTLTFLDESFKQPNS